jgi:hypothetical protein
MGLGERLGRGAGAVDWVPPKGPADDVVSGAENGDPAGMTMTALTIAIIALIAPATADAPTHHPRAGDSYEITRVQQTESRGTDGSSSTAFDKDSLLESVIAVRADGLELEYDLPAVDTGQRDDQWQFPARIFKPRKGPLELLNRAAMEARVEAWLKRAKLPRTACAHWYFSWNAFQVQCDPQSVIALIEEFDLSVPDLREGAPYRDAEAGAPAPLKRRSAGPNGASFVVEMPINPDRVRRGQAEADVATGEISRKPVTLEAALRERAKEQVSGTISITLEADSAGNVRRRTRILKLKIRSASGGTETQTVTQTFERRLVEGQRKPPAGVQARGLGACELRALART